MERFGVSQVAATLGLTLFVAGYGLGPMVWAPMSEIPQIGRNPIYIGTLVVFVFFQFAVIYAKNFGMLLAFRFLTGLFGSPVLATGGASLSDMYMPSKRGKFNRFPSLPRHLHTWGRKAGAISRAVMTSLPSHWEQGRPNFFAPNSFILLQC
jgi:MFS family permease